MNKYLSTFLFCIFIINQVLAGSVRATVDANSISINQNSMGTNFNDVGAGGAGAGYANYGGNGGGGRNAGGASLSSGMTTGQHAAFRSAEGGLAGLWPRS